MIFLFELIIPVFFVIIFTILYERWKEGNTQPVKEMLFLNFARLMVCFVSICVVLFIFGYLLGASDIQLMIIVAVTFGVTYAVFSYFLEN